MPHQVARPPLRSAAVVFVRGALGVCRSRSPDRGAGGAEPSPTEPEAAGPRLRWDKLQPLLRQIRRWVRSVDSRSVHRTPETGDTTAPEIFRSSNRPIANRSILQFPRLPLTRPLARPLSPGGRGRKLVGAACGGRDEFLPFGQGKTACFPGSILGYSGSPIFATE